MGPNMITKIRDPTSTVAPVWGQELRESNHTSEMPLSTVRVGGSARSITIIRVLIAHQRVRLDVPHCQLLGTELQLGSVGDRFGTCL